MTEFERLRAPAPSDCFHQISLGSRVLFVCHADRVSPGQVAREMAYWRGLFGAQVQSSLVHGGDDFALAQLVLAIGDLSPHGIGIKPQHLLDLGFGAELVARRFAEALAYVRRVNPAPDPGADNQAPDPGADNQAPDPGADNQAPDPGAANNSPDPGAANNSPDPGADNQAPDPGAENNSPAANVVPFRRPHP